MIDFLKMIKSHSIYNIPEQEGNSSFCLPFICETADIKNRLEKFLQDNGIETRPLCSGNLLRQPFLEGYSLDIDEEANVNFFA